MNWKLNISGVLVLAVAMAVAQTSGRDVGVATDVDGRAVPLIQAGRGRAVVLYFIASDCPISNRTLPEMKRLQSEFSKQGVQFWYVYPNTTETTEAIHEHLRAYNIGDVALTDRHGKLVRMTSAKWTPESAVLVPDKDGFRTVYLGRIDDRYLGIGRERPKATQHDLEDAVASVLAGRKPKPPGGPSVGCGIVGAP